MEVDLEDIFKNKITGDELYEMLVKYSDEEDIYEVLFHILDKELINNEESEYLIENLFDLDDKMEILTKIFTYDNEKDFSVLFNKISYLLGGVDKNDLGILIKKVRGIQKESNLDISDKILYIEQLYNSKRVSKKPDWVSLKDNENLTLLKTVSPKVELNNFSDSDILNKLIKSEHPLLKEMNIKGKDDENFMSIMEYLSESTKIVGEHNPDRIFGPPDGSNRECNTFLNVGEPCRMLECECNNYEEDEDSKWFTGNCNNCNSKIINKSHAVRYPNIKGGWDGCYCCIGCILVDKDIEDNYEEMFRMEALEFTLNEIGIMDRNME